MELIVSLFVSVIAQIIKKFGLKDKLNGLGVHFLLIGLALLFSAAKYGWQFIPEVYAVSIVQIWAGSVVLYEFFYKSLFKETIKHE